MRHLAFVPASTRRLLSNDPGSTFRRRQRAKPQREDGSVLAHARSLVLQHGWNSTAHQALDVRLRHWFSAAGDAMVAYTTFAGVRVVAGAPVAAPERLAAVAAEFESNASAAGQVVCYFAAEERLRSAGGYGAHVIGAQPTWTPASWAARFDGSASLRAQRNRAANKGVSVRESPSADELGADIASCFGAWRKSKRLPPLGFLAQTGPQALCSEAQYDKRLFVARLGLAAPEQKVVGYLTASPIAERQGWLIDKVVRSPHAPNGTTELLLDVAVRELGATATHITLGLAPLAAGNAGARKAELEPAWLRTAEWVARTWCGAFYDFRGLYEFKRKFQPDMWEPVYLLAPQRRVGFRDCVAVAAAFLPAGTFSYQAR